MVTFLQWLCLPFIIEVVDKVHRQLAYIGRHKMLHVLRGHFWHPSLDKISREMSSLRILSVEQGKLTASGSSYS